MNRHLFVVARDQSDLCAYLQREFSTEENVEIVLDRRQERDRRSGRDRRTASRSESALDRRATDRRVRKAVAAQLRSYGYAMLNVG
jgi:hypothetical protein